jgi:hypothetical protein
MLKDMAGVAMSVWDNADRARQRPSRDRQRSPRRTLA